MVHGSAEISTRAFDPRRFGRWADADYARRRAAEDYTLRQAMPLPCRSSGREARNIRLSGAHEYTRALGALYEEAEAGSGPASTRPTSRPAGAAPRASTRSKRKRWPCVSGSP